MASKNIKSIKKLIPDLLIKVIKILASINRKLRSSKFIDFL